MGLLAGTRLGPYEIISALGAGGMGEVYRAHDTRLDRDVAIKVLSPELSSDSASRERLQREAKAVSKLSHPHICTLHDIGHQDDVDFLVMEVVEGETLESRLHKGALPPDKVIEYAAQLASALNEAHKRGITHRDLKPSNIILTRTGAKLMDFGLARQSATILSANVLEELTTEQSKLTSEGSIVGTFQYMAPEQMEGRAVDARTDIFALGLVIYEMLTGQPAFQGRSRASLIAAVLSSEPRRVSELQPLTPPVLERVISRCLAKNPDDRWQCTGDLAGELKWVAEEPSRPTASSSSSQSVLWKYTTLGFVLLLVSLVLAGFFWRKSLFRDDPPMYFNASLPFEAHDLAISSDGKFLAMVGYSTQANNYVLWVHEVGARRTTALEGTAGASYPFWAPNGRYIGFFADGKLKKIAVSGGEIEVLGDAPNGRGGTWNRDNVILFTPDATAKGVYRISAGGGSATEVTRINPDQFEQSHRWAAFLPDGKHFLYLAANFSGSVEYNALYVGSLDSGEKHIVINTSSNAVYAEPGYLVYMRDNRTLVAQHFDLGTFKLSGEPYVLEDEVLYYPGVDRAVFALSRNVLVTQRRTGANDSQLTWFDRGGKILNTVSSPASYSNVRLSPDGRKLAADQSDAEGRNIDIWIHDLNRGSKTRLTFGPGLVQMPSWSPDGSKVLFAGNHKLGWEIYQKNADGSGSEQRVGNFGAMNEVSVWDWSNDGKFVVARKGNELWYLTYPQGDPKPLLEGKTVENAQFSPNDRWVAYACNESGRMEVYVSPFPSFDTKWQISNGGGREPKWRKDGKELFYISAEGKMMSVALGNGPTFEAGSPAALFQTRVRQPVSAQDRFSYDVSGDGQRFLVITKAEADNVAPLSVLLNWRSSLH